MNSSYNKKSKQNSRKKTYTISVAAIVVVLLGAGIFVYLHHKSSSSNASSENTGATSDTNSGINLNPPTEEEKKATEQHKSDIVNQQDTDGSAKNTNQQLAVTPVITNASKTAITAYVPGVFEDGGTCTATLTYSGQTITKTSTGFKNASYTQCPPFDLSSTDLGGHTWSVTIRYVSSTASGTSQATSIKS